jgi:hypothetical protein
MGFAKNDLFGLVDHFMQGIIHNQRDSPKKGWVRGIYYRAIFSGDCFFGMTGIFYLQVNLTPE